MGSNCTAVLDQWGNNKKHKQPTNKGAKKPEKQAHIFFSRSAADSAQRLGPENISK